MSNELTHGLTAAATTSIMFLLAGEAPLSTPVFFAGFVGMLINLDRGGAMNGRRTPYGHSLAYGILWLYVAVTSVYFMHFYGVQTLGGGLPYTVAFGCAYFSHLALDMFSEEGVFLFPFYGCGRLRDWGNWSRLRFGNGKAKASAGELNAALASVLLACIALA